MQVASPYALLAVAIVVLDVAAAAGYALSGIESAGTYRMPDDSDRWCAVRQGWATRWSS